MKFKKIYIEITNICNKNCSFCSPSKKLKQEMSPSLFSHVINEIKPYTDYIYLHVKGEPLIHTKFKEIIDICSNNDIKVNITTNGSYLKIQKSILCNTTIRQINISMQSYENEPDIEEINNNLNIVDELLEKNKNLNVVYRFWAIKDDKFTKSNLKILELIINHYNLENKIIDNFTKENNIKIKDRLYINILPIFDWPDINDKHISSVGTCYGTRSHIGILVDGTVIPCCLDGNGIINMGNIFEKPLKEILEDTRFTFLHKNILNNKFNEELCQHCSYKDRFSIKIDK